MENALLILGAGQYGRLVFEIADSMGTFSKIDFLDDNSADVIAKISEYKKFVKSYSSAIVAIGNATLRETLLRDLKDAGFLLPAIISPAAFVSKNAKISEGVVIEPMATIQTGAAVGTGSFISSGAVIRHNAVVGDFCHCDCNSVIMSSANVPNKTKIECLTVYK